MKGGCKQPAAAGERLHLRRPSQTRLALPSFTHARCRQPRPQCPDAKGVVARCERLKPGAAGAGVSTGGLSLLQMTPAICSCAHVTSDSAPCDCRCHSGALLHCPSLGVCTPSIHLASAIDPAERGGGTFAMSKELLSRGWRAITVICRQGKSRSHSNFISCPAWLP